MFRKIILPLSLPGVLSGVTMVLDKGHGHPLEAGTLVGHPVGDRVADQQAD